MFLVRGLLLISLPCFSLPSMFLVLLVASSAPVGGLRAQRPCRGAHLGCAETHVVGPFVGVRNDAFGSTRWGPKIRVLLQEGFCVCFGTVRFEGWAKILLSVLLPSVFVIAGVPFWSHFFYLAYKICSVFCWLPLTWEVRATKVLVSSVCRDRGRCGRNHTSLPQAHFIYTATCGFKRKPGTDGLAQIRATAGPARTDCTMTSASGGGEMSAA